MWQSSYSGKADWRCCADLGALQSLIQLGVAINAAIFSFASLREPLVAREKEAVDALTKQYEAMSADPAVVQSAEWKKFRSQYFAIKAAFVECEAAIKRGDKWIQVLAGAAALMSMIGLVISSYRSSDGLDLSWATFFVALAVVPSLAALGFNIFIVTGKLNAIRALRMETDNQLFDLYK